MKYNYKKWGNMMKIYSNKDITEREVFDFLDNMKNEFPISLDCKTNLKNTANKLYNKGAIFLVKDENNKIIGLIGGYINDLISRRGYISVVVLKKEIRGKGIASSLVSKFLNEAKNHNMKEVWLYTYKNNNSAIKMYEKLGFKYVKEQNNDFIYIKRF